LSAHLLGDISALHLVVHFAHAAPLVVDVGGVEGGKDFKVNAKVLLAILAVDPLQLVFNRGEVDLQRGVIPAAWSVLV